MKNWKVKDLLGWVSVRLDDRSYESFDKNADLIGVRTAGMIVEGDGSLVAENDKYVTAEVFLRLLKQKVYNLINSKLLTTLVT